MANDDLTYEQISHLQSEIDELKQAYMRLQAEKELDATTAREAAMERSINIDTARVMGRATRIEMNRTRAEIETNRDTWIHVRDQAETYRAAMDILHKPKEEDNEGWDK